MASLIRAYFKRSDTIKKYDDVQQSTNDVKRSQTQDQAMMYYDLATDIYESGWGESFHFAPRHKKETFEQSLARHEHYLALRLGLKKGMRVLDVGCGVGGPAREIARFSGARVTGLNLNKYQIMRARKLTAAEKDVKDICDFQEGDFHNIPLEPETFDAAYAIEATCHAKDLALVYAQIYKVLKPGALFAAWEWVFDENLYDPSNAKHRAIKQGIEEGDGLPDINTKKQVRDKLQQVGFELLEAFDPSPDNELPWYSTLGTTFSMRDFRFTWAGREAAGVVVWLLEKLRIAPKGTKRLHTLLNSAAKSLVDGGKTGLFTATYFVLARKPLNAAAPAK